MPGVSSLLIEKSPSRVVCPFMVASQVAIRVAIRVAVGSFPYRRLGRSRLHHDFCNGFVMRREALELAFVDAVSDVPFSYHPEKDAISCRNGSGGAS